MRTRSAIGLLGYALAAGLILVLLATALKPIRSDFVSYYAAGTVMRSDSGRLYDRQLQSDTQARLGAKVYLPFVYPPTVALIFVPFSSLDFATAYAVWLGVNLSLLVFCLWLLIRRLGLSESQSEGLQALVLVFLPVYVALVQGQLSVVMLLLFALFFFDDSKRAGIWAGLLLMKPVLAIVPFLILLLNRNRKGLSHRPWGWLCPGPRFGRTGRLSRNPRQLGFGEVHDRGPKYPYVVALSPQSATIRLVHWPRQCRLSRSGHSCGSRIFSCLASARLNGSDENHGCLSRLPGFSPSLSS